MDDEAALAAAQGYYDALPYAEGYEYRYVEKFDDQSWMYCFDRPVSVELWGEAQILYSAYEEVGSSLTPAPAHFRTPIVFTFRFWTIISPEMSLCRRRRPEP